MKRVLVLFVILFLTSCGVSKAKFLSSGSVQEAPFFSIVPYDSLGNWIIINVLVNGEDARFLFDTGAPCAITPELASKLNLPTELTLKVNDSGGLKSTKECVYLDSVSIDNVVFKDLAAIVVDFSVNEILKCMDIDGIVGANLMRQAYWELNFQEKNLSFSNDISKLTDTSDFSIMKFTPKRTGTPSVDITLNDTLIKNVTFDTGSNGYLSVKKGSFSILKEKPFYSRVGAASTGIHGLGKADTTYHRIDKVKLNDELELGEVPVSYSGNSKLLGTMTMENYRVILDWNSEQIFLKQEKEMERPKMVDFGFSLNILESKLFIGTLIQNSDAERKLKSGDQVLRFNDQDFEKVSGLYFCDFFTKGTLKTEYGNLLKVKIKRGEEILDFELKKETFLE